MSTGTKRWKHCANRECSTHGIRVQVTDRRCIACGKPLHLVRGVDPLADLFDPDLMSSFFGGTKR